MIEELKQMLEKYYKISNNLCPNDEEMLEDGEEIFDNGRGQGIFEVCQQVKIILEKYHEKEI